jgi:hypothetical protein
MVNTTHFWCHSWPERDALAHNAVHRSALAEVDETGDDDARLRHAAWRDGRDGP